jgi:pilin isopeptide linkage protein/LPXTG-motif cell wall-anchored protein
VDHATFDVKLVLRPDTEVTYEYDNGTGTWVETFRKTYTPEDPGPEENIDSAIFHMKRQDVIDAFNKCPNHSGLDFTIKASSALVQFEAGKELLNGHLTGGDFEFEIVDDHDNVVAQATNDQNGHILFEGIHFENEGTYNYRIREIPGTDEDIIYDTTEYPVTIVVERLPGEENFLIAEVQTSGSSYDYTFHNKVKFSLPDTGGGGIVPFIAVGISLIGTALILLMLRRRKEVDL